MCTHDDHVRFDVLRLPVFMMLRLLLATIPIAVSVVRFLQGRAFVHCDVVGLVALDFILRVFLARVVGIPFIINISCVHFNDLAADLSGLRVPRHVIPDAKPSGHVGIRRAVFLEPQRLNRSINRGIPEAFRWKNRLLLRPRWFSRTRLRPEVPRDPGELARPPISCRHFDK
jgi:hypothetical protein